jgi:hypothetical protein
MMWNCNVVPHHPNAEIDEVTAHLNIDEAAIRKIPAEKQVVIAG